MTVCWAKEEGEARHTAHEYWPTAAFTGELSQVLPVPAHFEQVAKMVSEEDVAKNIVCGPDPERYLAKINEYVEAGYDHVWLHQVGPDQEGFFRFFEKEVFPKLDRE
jgi:coenzyme F420-dependent glucose-6-phosphate dehydrogenase